MKIHDDWDKVPDPLRHGEKRKAEVDAESPPAAPFKHKSVECVVSVLSVCVVCSVFVSYSFMYRSEITINYVTREKDQLVRQVCAKPKLSK